VKVTGRYTDGTKFSETVAARETPLAALGHLWARTRVVDREDRFRAHPSDELKREIVALAIQHTLLTRFTAFIAVDESGGVVNKDGARRKLVQPVEMPAQWAPQLAAAPVFTAGAGGRPHWPAAPTMAVAGKKVQATVAAAKSSAAQAMGRLFSSAMGPASPGREAPPMAREEVAQLAGPVDRASLEPALEALLKAVAEARVQLARGATPAPDALEKARAALLQALARSAIAGELPLLQKFLRASAVELVAALAAGPGAALGTLVALFARHAAALVAAREEARAALGHRGKPAPDSFWEATI
jgi:Ca-activated chloride channel family protein